jgi:hypothetical protein
VQILSALNSSDTISNIRTVLKLVIRHIRTTLAGLFMYMNYKYQNFHRPNSDIKMIRGGGISCSSDGLATHVESLFFLECGQLSSPLSAT